MKLVGMEGFAFRQFVEGYRGSYIPNITPNDFLKKVNEYIKKNKPSLTDGYSNFCKHLFIPNFTEAKKSVIRITTENEKFLKTGYNSRREFEIPVLTRWFPKDSEPARNLTKGKYLDIILYSKQQCDREAEAIKEHITRLVDDEEDPDWYIISIKVQDENYETPMEPITMLRNTLIEEGGSGIPLDREKYMKSVYFWEKHAIVC